MMAFRWWERRARHAARRLSEGGVRDVGGGFVADGAVAAGAAVVAKQWQWDGSF